MVRSTQVEAAEHAGMWSMARAYAPDELTARDRLLDRTYERFVDRVAAGRQLDLQAAGKIARGRIWTGAEAKELGLVSHAHLGHGAPTYHLADRHDHMHLVCRDCDKITEAKVELARPLKDGLRDAFGFETDMKHFAIFGRCEDCARKAAAGPA